MQQPTCAIRSQPYWLPTTDVGTFPSNKFHHNGLSHICNSKGPELKQHGSSAKGHESINMNNSFGFFPNTHASMALDKSIQSFSAQGKPRAVLAPAPPSGMALQQWMSWANSNCTPSSASSTSSLTDQVINKSNSTSLCFHQSFVLEELLPS